MKDYGEIPGGKSSLKPLLYAFNTSYPLKLWSRYRWYKNSQLRYKLRFLNISKRWITVIDRLGAPGDVLITSNVIRCIKQNYPNLKINCITPNPDLIKFDPNINSINKSETFYSFDSSYWELIVRKEVSENIIFHNLNRIGIKKYDYQSKFYLSEKEKLWARNILTEQERPFVAICTKSKEPVKNWPIENWQHLIKILSKNFHIVHLGDEREPVFKNIHRFAGKLTIRESAALLQFAKIFIGPDSLLMHIANGLNIKSVIIFGGSRPIKCFGYNRNENLSSRPHCSPCWIHEKYETCSYNIKCMDSISVSDVLHSFEKLYQHSNN